MILNERELFDRLTHPDTNKRIIITPIINPGEQFGPTSVDIRIGTDFKTLDVANVSLLDPTGDELGSTLPRMRRYQVPPDRAFILHPGEFALGASLEFIRVPADISVRVEGRSSWGRLGLLVHATAGFVDPGFSGSITFELHNVGRVPMALYPGVRIAQLCFFAGQPTSLPYDRKIYTKYSGKTTAFASQYHQDPEYAGIRRRRR
ncbi:MAG: dCTP deaminase [Cyanobacteria bacterium NC_groundwater_1444_Ag_S-0.65um_54_12]|nr:dCTP deaminase [Cyanobacteria bacterium NC_groundwater_1444_Ag_S-0.65um_54_12]